MIPTIIFVLMVFSSIIISYSLVRVFKEYQENKIPLWLMILMIVSYLAVIGLIAFAMGVSDIVQQYLSQDVVILYTL